MKTLKSIVRSALTVMSAGMCLLIIHSCAGIPDTGYTVAEINFGLFPQSDTIHTAVVEVSNAGRGTLVLEEPVTSCDCTEAVPSSYRMRHGEKSFIKVTYNSNDKWPGIVNQGVSFKCNTPTGNLYIRVTGCMYDDSGNTVTDFRDYQDWPVFVKESIPVQYR